jgi:hypothetical protein
MGTSLCVPAIALPISIPRESNNTFEIQNELVDVNRGIQRLVQRTMDFELGSFLKEFLSSQLQNVHELFNSFRTAAPGLENKGRDHFKFITAFYAGDSLMEADIE